jgi:hypothetical protein
MTKWPGILLLTAGVLSAADGPRLFYSKSFPGSVPAYTQVTVEKSGAVVYQEAAEDDLPLKFQLTPEETQQLFDLAAKLDYFKRPLESGLKVAFMGEKTFRFEGDGQKGEAKFNYSDDPGARELLDWFERIAESAQHRIELERAAKYDKLGVFKALGLLESAMQRNRLVALEQYLPMLDRIARNETYMHTARARAAAMAEAIRTPKPAEPEPQKK